VLTNPHQLARVLNVTSQADGGRLAGSPSGLNEQAFQLLAVGSDIIWLAAS